MQPKSQGSQTRTHFEVDGDGLRVHLYGVQVRQLVHEVSHRLVAVADVSVEGAECHDGRWARALHVVAAVETRRDCTTKGHNQPET
jgi:hypothetical protein